LTVDRLLNELWDAAFLNQRSTHTIEEHVDLGWHCAGPARDWLRGAEAHGRASRHTPEQLENVGGLMEPLHGHDNTREPIVVARKASLDRAEDITHAFVGDSEPGHANAINFLWLHLDDIERESSGWNEPANIQHDIDRAGCLPIADLEEPGWIRRACVV
jgi:hypothetical protein